MRPWKKHWRRDKQTLETVSEYFGAFRTDYLYCRRDGRMEESMSNTNFFQCEFSAQSQNEALARAVVTAFVIPLDPTVEELSDLRTAVSEAVTNSIIHGYRNGSRCDRNDSRCYRDGSRCCMDGFSPEENVTPDHGTENRNGEQRGAEAGTDPSGGKEALPVIRLTCSCCGPKTVKITVEDFGCGIEDIALARQPMFTSSPELERSGLGFTIMESFMDSLEVESDLGKGTKVVMTKSFLIPAEG